LEEIDARTYRVRTRLHRQVFYDLIEAIRSPGRGSGQASERRDAGYAHRRTEGIVRVGTKRTRRELPPHLVDYVRRNHPDVADRHVVIPV
jgi:hypothetical protein